MYKMETVVVEERLYKSSTKIRSLLTDVRKALVASNTTSTFYEFKSSEDEVKIKDIKFFHVHSDCPLNLSLKANGQSISLKTNFFTISGDLDQVLITSSCEGNTFVPSTAYLTYAAK